MVIEQEIRERLNEAFHPERLEVVNESHRHAGHAGDDGSGESHFAVVIRAAAFGPLTRLQRHRAVQAALGDINQRVHTLALDIA